MYHVSWMILVENNLWREKVRCREIDHSEDYFSTKYIFREMVCREAVRCLEMVRESLRHAVLKLKVNRNTSKYH